VIKTILRKLLRRNQPVEVIKTVQERYPEYQIGKHTYSDDLAVYDWGSGATLSIGKYCSLAHGVTIILDGEHRSDWVTSFPFSEFWPSASHINGHPSSKGDVTIGHDVWIGNGAVILSGVNIGNGAVIGARAIVSKDVAPYSIVVGNPAREIRKRFEPSAIDALQSLCWWDWSESHIERLLPQMLSTDIKAFIDAAKSITNDE